MDSRFCTFCGALIEPGVKKCPRCGADIEMKKEPSSKQDPSSIILPWNGTGAPSSKDAFAITTNDRQNLEEPDSVFQAFEQEALGQRDNKETKEGHSVDIVSASRSEEHSLTSEDQDKWNQ